MKKVVALLLVTVMCIGGAAGCQKQEPDKGKQADKEQTDQTKDTQKETQKASGDTEPSGRDFTDLYKEVASLTDKDAVDFFKTLPDKGLTQDEILQFFIDLPISPANKQINEIYESEGLGIFADDYPKGEPVDGYVWEIGKGTGITGPYSKLDLKLPFADYVPLEEGPVGDPDKTYKIGFVFHGFDHPWLINYADSAEWEAKRHSNVDMKVLDAEYDNAKQAAYIDQFIADGVDGIIVWPQEVAPTGPPIDRALAAGIPVVTSDRMSGSKDVNARVTGGLPSNGAQMGMFLADKMAEEDNYSYKMVMLRKPLGASSEALRTGYMLKVMSYFPGVEILQSYHDSDNREEAFANAQAALQAYPEIDVFYATGDHEALAAIEATEQAKRLNSRADGKKIIFVTPDDSKETMAYIDKGILDMDVPLTPLQADIAVRAMIKIITGEEVPYNVMVPNIPMVTKEGKDIFGFKTQKTDEWYQYTFGPPIE